jgi:hypothetical protein
MTTPPAAKVYLPDTNILIGFSLWLPLALHKVFWTRLAESLEMGEWVLLDVVMKEIKYNPELEKWCKDQEKKGLVITLEDSYRDRGAEINNLYKMIDATTQKSTVDTYIIAYAEANKLILFSRESPRKSTNDLYKIPDVCSLLNVERIAKPEAFLKAISFQN